MIKYLVYLLVPLILATSSYFSHDTMTPCIHDSNFIMFTTPSSQGHAPFCVCMLPSYRVVELWREDLAKTNAKAAQSLADPTEYENLFPELKQALQAEEFLKKERSSLLPAATFTSVPVSLSLSLASHTLTYIFCLKLLFCFSSLHRTPVNVMSLKS